ncbi:MAG TPA: DNA repair protein RadA [Acidimicrobiales bacterium]|nr:DNA repair protein RadA [Acidimicrobiales bacterium]
MAKAKTIHRCTDCGATALRWAGKCPTCGEWNTLVEEVEAVPSTFDRLPPGPLTVPQLLGEVDHSTATARSTGLGELDRVLSGGLVPGSVTLVGGEPGIGKSTLLLQAMSVMASGGEKCLLVSAEESAQQVRLRADRLPGELPPHLWILAETAMPSVVTAIDALQPSVVVIDSIQTVHEPEATGTPGCVTQVRACAGDLVAIAKQRGVSVVLVGHVTKDGALAGPRQLEHIVDTVLSFEGDRHHALRLLRAVKHRFGATGELGIFEMTEEGLIGVPDAGALLLHDRREGVSGSVVMPAMEGHRPVLVEVQALIASGETKMPKRSAQGVDSARVSVILAVIEERLRRPMSDNDVYVSAVGGVRVTEPAGDLAIGLALLSAREGIALPPGVVAFGEVGLGGEVRQAGQTSQRLAEAARLGFTTAVVPASAPDGPPGMQVLKVHSLLEAARAVGLGSPSH